MSYFVTKEELLSEIEKAVDGIFTAVGRMFSDEDKEFNKKLKELEIKFSLLINTVGYKSYQLKKENRRKHMSEKTFEEILKELANHIMDSDDEKAIILIDELEQSVEKFKEEKERIKLQLNKIYKKTEAFMKQEGIEKKEKEQESEKGES